MSKKALLICLLTLSVIIGIGTPNDKFNKKQAKLNDTLIPCFVDFNGDGTISLLGQGELQLLHTSEECLILGGNVGISGNKLSGSSLTGRQTRLAANPSSSPISTYSPYPSQRPVVSPASSPQPSQAPVISPTSSPQPTQAPVISPTSSPQPSQEPTKTPIYLRADVPQGVKGFVNNIPTGIMPQSLRDTITRKVGPSIKGRQYDEENYICRDFANTAELSYRELTYTSVDCYLTCKVNRPRIPGSKVPQRTRTKELASFGHAINDVHQDGKIYFFEPQQLVDGKTVAQVDLDLNNDGKVSPTETGGSKDFDLSDLFPKVSTRQCKPDSFRISCKILSFDNMNESIDYFDNDSIPGNPSRD